MLVQSKQFLLHLSRAHIRTGTAMKYGRSETTPTVLPSSDSNACTLKIAMKWASRHGEQSPSPAPVVMPIRGNIYSIPRKIYVSLKPLLESIATQEGWWQRQPLSAGRIELQHAVFSSKHVESKFVPFDDIILTSLCLNRVFCMRRSPFDIRSRFPRRRTDLRLPERYHLPAMILSSQ